MKISLKTLQRNTVHVQVSWVQRLPFTKKTEQAGRKPEEVHGSATDIKVSV